MTNVTEWADYGRFQTGNDLMKEVLRAAEKAAWLQTSVYIFGEPGTGRRSLGRWIFERSPHRAGRFLVWNHDEDLRPQTGDTVLVENAQDLGPAQLLKIRKCLEETAAGAGSRARWLVTSGCEARTWMESSALARDLAYRLCVATLRMPRLQERREDIEGLARLFLKVACLVNGVPEKYFSAGAIEALQSHEWTGHVAELNNAVERAVLNSETNEISVSELSFLSQPAGPVETLGLAQAGMSLFEMEKKLIFQTLEMTRQNKTRAAQILGISIRTLRNKLNAYREGRGDEQCHV